MRWGKKLRRSDSNRRPSGYEPDELPLLHAARRGYRTWQRALGGSDVQCGVGVGGRCGTVTGLAVGVGVGLGFAEGDGVGVGVGGGLKIGSGTDTPPVAARAAPGGTMT